MIKRLRHSIYRKRLSNNWYKNAILMSRFHGFSIGKNCSFNRSVNFGSEPYLIRIGEFVRISSNVKFVNHDGAIHVMRQLHNKKYDIITPIKVGDNVFIGTDSIILPGVEIGNNCIIGAGSIVTRNTEPNSVYAGIPAKRISSVDDYYNKNKEKIHETKSMTFDEKRKYYLEFHDGF